MKTLKALFLGSALFLFPVIMVQASELDVSVPSNLSSGLIVRTSAVNANDRTVYTASMNQAVASDAAAEEAAQKIVGSAQAVSTQTVHELDQITSDESWCYWPSYNYYSYYWYGYNYTYYPTYSWYNAGYYYYYYYYRY